MGSNGVTIKDVAKAAGVSVTTVAQALNNNRPVNEDTRQRVLAVVESLGYIPSYSASHMKRKNSGIIGCFTVDISEDFTSRILKGAEREVTASGLSMLIASVVEFGYDYDKARRFFYSYNVDGLIICHHLSVDPGFIKALANPGFPVVFVNIDYPNKHSIIPDNKLAGSLAADHLVSLGAKNLAFIGGPSNRLSVTQRLEGFSEKLKDLKINFDKNLIVYGDYSFKDGMANAEVLYRINPNIDGLFCANDYIAAGALRFFEKQGKNIPQDLKIVGCDNREFSSFWDIPITTIQLPLEEMGAHAIKDLRSMLQVQAVGPSQYLKPTLIKRESSINTDTE